MRIPTIILRSWRSLGIRTFVLGLLLTITVICLDEGGQLRVIERVAYNERVRHCQYWSPPPSDRIVHLDVDDAALDTIGRWPWPRATMAEIIDEVRLAGADLLALDVIYSEPQDIEYRPVRLPPGQPATAAATQPASTRPGDVAPAGPVAPPTEPVKFDLVDHDARLAEAVGRFGRVLVPLSLDTNPTLPPSPTQVAATDVLAADLELSREQVMARLPGVEKQLRPDDFVFARREAFSRRIRAELARGPVPAEVVRAKLLPGLKPEDTSTLAGQFQEVYRNAAAVRAIDRFARDLPPNCPPLIRASRPNTVPLPVFARAAGMSGYVDYLETDPEFGDATIRGVPLWMNLGGRLYPQMALAVACAAMGADPKDVQIGRDELVIRAKDGRTVVVPVRVQPTAKFGDIGALFDAPWFGTDDWKTMYDYLGHQDTLQHVPAAEVWGLADSRKIIARNYVAAGPSMELLVALGSKNAETFLAKRPNVEEIDAWATAFERSLREVAEALEPVRKDAPAKRSADDQAALDAYDRVALAAAEARKFAAKAAVVQQKLRGKVVYFGGTATTLGDVKPTPLQASCPGVVMHGVVTNALLTGHFWYRAPGWVTPLITLCMGLAVTLVVIRLSPGAALMASLALVVGYALINGYLLFDRGNTIVGLAGPLVVAALTWGVLTMSRYIAEQLERKRITRRFQRYVDPALVNYLIENPDLVNLEGEVREMTVVFTDLAGYTSLTEKLRERAVRILSRYKTVMVPAIRRHRGFIHSFMGDGIMFSYGAPQENSNHAIDALNTILDVQEVMRLFNAELATQNLGPLVTRVGVCTGPAVVGDSGSEEGSDYACLGNTTNLAARLESANKAVGTVMMISERTAELLGGRFLLRPIAKLTVKGKTVPEMTFEPLALADEATDEHRRLAALTTAMFDAYVAGRFADCAAAADAMDAAVGASKLAALYRETAQEYLAAGGPPADFQGQIVLKEK